MDHSREYLNGGYSNPFLSPEQMPPPRPRRRRQWTPRDEVILRAYVPRQSPQALADYFNCTVEDVMGVAKRLGLRWD